MLLAPILLGGSIWYGCSVEKHYDTLSFFFDGVPDPNAPAPGGPFRSGTNVAAGAIRSSHSAYEERRCNECHEGASDFGFRVSGFTDLDATVCLKCHADELETDHRLHGPVAARACLICHDPHESTQPHLLARESSPLCLTCHEFHIGREPRPAHHGDLSRDCVQCHYGHGGRDPYFLKEWPAPQWMTDPAPPSGEVSPDDASIEEDETESPPPTPSSPEEPEDGAAGESEVPTQGQSIEEAVSPPVSASKVRVVSPSMLEMGFLHAVIATTSTSAPGGGPSTRSVSAIRAAQAFQALAAMQDQGPVRISPKQEYDSVVLDDFKAALRLEYRLDNDEVEGAAGDSERDREDRFREILELSTHGYIGHPNLIELNLAGEFWLTQRSFDLESTGEDGDSNELLLDYDVSAVILRESKLPITIYGRQTINDINRQFGGSLENTVTEYGVRMDVRHDMFPTHVEVFRREQDQSVSAGGDDFLIEQNTFQADGLGNFSKTQQFWWDFAFDDVSEAGSLRTPQDFQRTEFNATHTIDFGSDDQHQLRSSGRYYKESGDRDFQQMRLNERLRLRHTDNLWSRYDYTGLWLERSDFEQELHEFSALFNHQLYDSLNTIGRASYRMQDIPTGDFRSDELSADLTLDYRKNVPYGRLSAGASVFASHLEESDVGARLEVFDRFFTFDASGLIIITQQRIDPDSIVIRDAVGFIIFSEGADYTVQAAFTRVEIRRVLGGDISAGQTVRIDYDILPEPGGTTTTISLGFDVRYEIDEGPFQGLALFAGIIDQEEDRSFDDRIRIDDMFDENDFTDIVYGVDYTRGRFYLRAEQRMHDSALDPFDATRFEGRYIQRLGRGSNLVFNALYQELDRTDEDHRTATTTVSAQWNQQITQRLRGNVVILWQNEDSSVGGGSQGYEQELGLRWSYGQTDVVAMLRNSIRDTEADDTMFQTVFVGVRREF